MGLALRARTTVLGVDRAPVVARAQQRGAIEAAVSLSGALAQCQALVVATPLEAARGILKAIGGYDSPPELVLDVAGVKQPVMQWAREAGLATFVGGHPMAGSEQHSIEAARADLFAGRPFVLCPGDNERAHDHARAIVTATGARTAVMDPATHDEAVAHASHLPHLLAQAMVACSTPTARALAAGSWRDVTRVAQSDPEQWSMLFAANSQALGAALDQLLNVLQRARARLHDPVCAPHPVERVKQLAEIRRQLDAALPKPR